MDIWCNAEDFASLFPSVFSIYWSCEGGVARARRFGYKNAHNVYTSSWHVYNESDLLKNELVMVDCIVMKKTQFASWIHEGRITELAAMFGLTNKYTAFLVECFMINSRFYEGRLSTALEQGKKRIEPRCADPADSLYRGIKAYADAMTKLTESVRSVPDRARISLLEKEKARLEGELKKAREEKAALERKHEENEAASCKTTVELCREINSLKLERLRHQRAIEDVGAHDDDSCPEDKPVKIKIMGARVSFKDLGPTPAEQEAEIEAILKKVKESRDFEDTFRERDRFYLRVAEALKVPDLQDSTPAPDGVTKALFERAVEKRLLDSIYDFGKMPSPEFKMMDRWHQVIDDKGRVTLPMVGVPVMICYLPTYRSLGIFERFEGALPEELNGSPWSALRIEKKHDDQSNMLIVAKFRKLDAGREQRYLTPEIAVWRYLNETEIADLNAKKD